jgi:hypothetical protein
MDRVDVIVIVRASFPRADQGREYGRSAVSIDAEKTSALHLLLDSDGTDRAAARRS